MQEVNFLCFPVFLLIEKRRLNGFSDDFVEFQAIGAEYGEGFETFRQDGPLKVDVVRATNDYESFIRLYLFLSEAAYGNLLLQGICDLLFVLLVNRISGMRNYKMVFFKEYVTQ